MATERRLLYVIRHGETDWNLEGRIQGRTDIPLNATGRAQADAVARRLQEIEPDPRGFRFVSSPLRRARETMAAIAQAYGLANGQVEADERLAELCFGVMEGKGWPDIHALGIDPARDPEGYHDWRPDGGESHVDATARIGAWLAEVDGPVVVVAHGGVSRILRGLALSLPKRQIVVLPTPQNRFCRIDGTRLDWIDCRGG